MHPSEIHSLSRILSLPSLQTSCDLRLGPAAHPPPLRYKQHRWDRPDYCGWAYEFHPDTDWRSPQRLNPALEGPGAAGAVSIAPTEVRKAREHIEELVTKLMLRLRQGLEEDKDPLGGLPTVIITLEPAGSRVQRLQALLKVFPFETPPPHN